MTQAMTSHEAATYQRRIDAMTREQLDRESAQSVRHLAALMRNVTDLAVRFESAVRERDMQETYRLARAVNHMARLIQTEVDKQGLIASEIRSR